MSKHDVANPALLVDSTASAYTHATDTSKRNRPRGYSGTVKAAMTIVYSRGAEEQNRGGTTPSYIRRLDEGLPAIGHEDSRRDVMFGDALMI